MQVIRIYDAEQADETVALVVFGQVGSKILELGGEAGNSYTETMKRTKFTVLYEHSR